MTAVGSIVVHRIRTGPWDQICYVAACDAGDAVVIDPGGEADLILKNVASNRLRVHAVLCTHGHHDHVGAVEQVTETYGVPFGIHSAESDALQRVNFHRLVFNDLEPVALPSIELDLAVATALRFGDLEIDILHTPGHSPGSVCIEIGGELFTGDTLMARHLGRSDLPGGDRGALEASVAVLGDRYPPEARLHPGHGESGTLGAALAGAAAIQERHP